MWILKILAFLWPFVKELVLGEKTVRQALKSNRWKVVLSVFICISFVVNLLAVPRLVVMANDYVKLNKTHELQSKTIVELNAKVKELEDKLKSKPEIPKPEKPSTVVIHGKRLPKETKVIEKDSIKKHFDKLKQKEAEAS